ncbi:MAG: DNA polymerase IV [Ruminococcaceae bacterium]|nr:DNA polymerase IV [Oscillospiraceae bacterium]
MKRIILHCDLNNFYASVECVKNPQLKGKCVAVCGSEDDRHGIVLAKSQPAKMLGVKTGDTIIEARRKCGNLIVVRPDFDTYYDYSEKVKSIYSRYTDLIEPFGMDECWLDISGNENLSGDGLAIAEELRNSVREETGLTISVGVSFNKVFAKLGSDMKKPDATTVISKENYKDKVWCLNANEMIFVGRRTFKTLQKYGIITIGDIARTQPDFLKKILGKNGFDLWAYANGLDFSPVSHIDSKPIPQSISRGITCMESLLSVYEAERVVAELSVKVSKNLRRERLLATGVQLAIKEDNLTVQQYSDNLEFPTHNTKEIYEIAQKLLIQKHIWKRNIRALTVRTYNLVKEENYQQLHIDFDIDTHEKVCIVDNTLNGIRKKLGNDKIFNGCRLYGTKMPTGKSEHSSLPPASF